MTIWLVMDAAGVFLTASGRDAPPSAAGHPDDAPAACWRRRPSCNAPSVARLQSQPEDAQRTKPSISSLAQAMTCSIVWPRYSRPHMAGIVARLVIGIAYSGGAGNEATLGCESCHGRIG